MTVSPDLILEQAAALHGLTVTPERAAELAKEIAGLSAAVTAAAATLDFNDEPAAFHVALRRLATPEAPGGR